MMMLGVDNSMHDKASGDFTMCRLTLFAPYWVDNRSGLDLLFKDGPSAKGHALLMGAHTFFDYAPVKAPGNFTLQLDSSGMHCSSASNSFSFEIAANHET